MTRHRTRYLLATAILVTTACAKKEAPAPAQLPAATQPAPPPAPLAIAAIDLGKGVDAMKMATGATTTFSPKDTIYASVSTTGSGSNATLAAKWTFVKKAGSETAVNESSQTITTSGPGFTEFHITKATPWPKGSYRVEILLNGATAGTKDFTVE
jgi:hypothetical protein